LYRWGKPATYGQTGAAILNVVHDAHWIPEEYVNGGRIVAFNNHGISTSISCVDQVSTPVSGYNYLYTPNTAYQPTSYTSRLACTGHTNNEGGSQQLPNGNQLVCIAFSGYIYEVDPSGNTIWSISIPGVVAQAFRYSDCYVNNLPPPIPSITQNGAVLTSSPAAVYQWYLNGTKISGETNQSYTATQSGVYLVRTTDSNGCVYRYSVNLIYSSTTSVDQNAISNDKYRIYPNPTTAIVRIEDRSSHASAFEVSVSDIAGRIIIRDKYRNFVDLSSFEDGVYNIVITDDDGSVLTKRIILIR
jgi:Secretion system C-terminal sorting domain